MGGNPKLKKPKKRNKNLVRDLDKQNSKQNTVNVNEYETETETEIGNGIGSEEIYGFWNEQNIIIHNKFTDSMRKQLEKKLKDNSAEDIKKAVYNYARVVNDEMYFFNYKWTFDEFLKRGFDKFNLEWETIHNNFKKDKNGRGSVTRAEIESELAKAYGMEKRN